MFTIAVAVTTNAVFSSLIIVSHCLYQVKRSCPLEEVEFICSNNDGLQVVMWTITSLSSGFIKSITFHSSFDTSGIWRSVVIDDSEVNASLLYGNSSWYLTSLTIPSTLSSDIMCNNDFLQYRSSNSKLD